MAKAVIKAKATMDNRQFKTGVAQMNQGVNRFANGQIKQMAGLIGGAFAVGAIINFTKEMFSAADAIDNSSKQMNIGVEALQALRRETELTAGSADKMDGTLRKLTKSMANAVAGESEQVDGFNDLGISIESLKGMSVDKAFEKIAQKVSGAGLTSKEASGASKILGRNYVELNSVMRKVADIGLQGLIDQMIETNQIMSKDSIVAADAMEESFNRSVRSMTNTMREWAMDSIASIQRVAAAAGELAGDGITGKDIMGAVINPVGAASKFVGRVAGGGNRAEMANPLEVRQNQSDLGGSGGLVPDAVKSTRIAPVKASDSIAKIGGILGGQSAQKTQEQTMAKSLRVQRESMAALEEIKKNTAPIRGG